MTTTTMADFADKAADVASLLRELANEKRLLILCVLMDQKEVTVNDLADAVDLSQSALSQHLSRLRQHNVVACRRDGATMLYSVADSNVGRILKTLKSIYC